MENKQKFNYNILNNSICQECGLPLRFKSYEIKDKDKESETIMIKLVCQNMDHKNIIDFNYKDYQNILDNNLKNSCKCMSCKNLILKDAIPFYCNECKEIICLNCKNNKHEHNNIYKYGYSLNMCLIHNMNNNQNNLMYYCSSCKKYLCKYCLGDDLEHFKNSYIFNINELNSNIKNIIAKVKNEQNNLIKKIKILENKIKFNKFLIGEYENNFYLLNNNDFYNNNSIQHDIERIDEPSNKSLIKDKKYNSINIIYHDSNLEKNERFKTIIGDSNYIEKETNSSFIITSNFGIFDSVLKYLFKNNMKSKFALIINGRSSPEIIKHIKENNYMSLFINSFIYTANINFKNNYPDFVKKICFHKNDIIQVIKGCFENNNIQNEKYYINKLINLETYNQFYLCLFEFYGKESINTFNSNFSIIKEFIENSEFPKEIKNKTIKDFQIFSELTKKNYEKIISYYLNNNNFFKILNLLLDKKDLSIYKKIGYFAGNLMHSIVEYGKKMKKEINSHKTFYRGVKLNIIEILEYFKNKNSIITYPYFLSVTTKKEYAETSSKRNITTDKERKEKNFYSVIFKINYLINDAKKPSAFELKDLSQNPEEEEFILLPFTFFNIENITIDTNKYIADIELKVTSL